MVSITLLLITKCGSDRMIIEMKNIRKSFGSNDVLKDVSFTLKGGEICALLGENGAGKSTLMNILGGVHTLDSGSITVDGRPSGIQYPSTITGSGNRIYSSGTELDQRFANL